MKKFFNSIEKFLRKSDNNSCIIDQIEDFIESDSQATNQNNTEKNELRLVTNVLQLRELTAGDIMVPRAEIIAARSDTTLKGFVDIFSNCGFSQIPIYNNTLDDVVGLVRIRDFLPCMLSPEKFDLQSVLREPIFVVPSMQILDLLVEIRASSNHMALVVDEFGGIDGLVTLNDVVTEIVGEIQHCNDILPQIVQRSDGSYITDARISLEECIEKLKINLLEPFVQENTDIDSIETLGGLITYIAGRVPTKGENIVHPSGIEFEIFDADLRKIKRVIIRNRKGYA